MCRESDPLLLAEEELQDALRLFYGGTPPPHELTQTATPQMPHDAEPAELVA
jgi:hypothetical protein